MKTENKLPSKAQINDKVNLVLFDAGKILNCTVIGVSFTESKVFYDIEVDITEGMSTTLSNIESNCIELVD